MAGFTLGVRSQQVRGTSHDPGKNRPADRARAGRGSRTAARANPGAARRGQQRAAEHRTIDGRSSKCDAEFTPGETRAGPTGPAGQAPGGRGARPGHTGSGTTATRSAGGTGAPSGVATTDAGAVAGRARSLRHAAATANPRLRMTGPPCAASPWAPCAPGVAATTRSYRRRSAAPQPMTGGWRKIAHGTAGNNRPTPRPHQSPLFSQEFQETSRQCFPNSSRCVTPMCFPPILRRPGRPRAVRRAPFPNCTAATPDRARSRPPGPAAGPARPRWCAD